jgi:hypothetical protein
MKKDKSMNKGISLHIALEHFNPDEYGGNSGRLPTCKKDMQDMEKIAKYQAFESTQLLLNEEATRDNVVSAITLASTRLQSGDMFFLSYSGHGTLFEDEDGDEEVDSDNEKAHDEAWCLYDGFLLDDELHYFWMLFEEGVRIFMISDSCHSGTMNKDVFNEGLPIEKSFSKEEAKNLYLKRKAYYDEIKKRASRAKEKEIKATVLLIAGCEDRESSHIFPPDENSVLTVGLNDVWSDGEFEGTTIEFFNQVKEIVVTKAFKKRKFQTPKLYIIGRENEDFNQQKPFVI